MSLVDFCCASDTLFLAYLLPGRAVFGFCQQRLGRSSAFFDLCALNYPNSHSLLGGLLWFTFFRWVQFNGVRFQEEHRTDFL